MSTEQSVDVCPVKVPDGGRLASFHTCGRAIKRDGMCGMHAAAEERRAATEVSWREEHAAQKALAAHLKEALAELGIAGTPYYSPLSHKYNGKVVVDIEDLQKAVGGVSRA